MFASPRVRSRNLCAPERSDRPDGGFIAVVHSSPAFRGLSTSGARLFLALRDFFRNVMQRRAAGLPGPRRGEIVIWFDSDAGAVGASQGGWSMKFGFIPTEGGTYYRQALDEVMLGEELGFDSVWMEEHHGVKNHYWPTPLMVLAGFATRTERVQLGTDVVILPFYHPTMVAEQAAMLDVISSGRAILGVAIGYRPDEFGLFEAPMQRRGARFEEQL